MRWPTGSAPNSYALLSDENTTDVCIRANKQIMSTLDWEFKLYGSKKIKVHEFWKFWLFGMWEIQILKMWSNSQIFMNL